jgi:hypothetical protein
MATTNYVRELIETNTNWISFLKSKNIIVKEYDDYVVLKYDMINCDFSDPYVRECRGLIVDLITKEVVCRAFDKFGNYGESYADDIDWNSAVVQEKIDGSIMKVWFNVRANKWIISTNNSYNADETYNGYDMCFGAAFREALTKQTGMEPTVYFDKFLVKGNTYIFELVSPDNKIVIPYDETKIYHIGTRNMETGKEFDTYIGIEKPKEYPLNSLEECIKAASAFKDLDHEGFVVVDKNWNRVKVKSPLYVAAHHVASNSVFTLKMAVDLVLTGEDGEYLTYFPEHKVEIDNVKKIIENETFSIYKTIESARLMQKINPLTRKEFALKFKNHKYFSFLIKGVFDNITEPVIAKNYWKKYFDI